MPDLRDRLALAELWVICGDMCITRQISVVLRLRSAQQDVRAALRLLAEFREIQARHIAKRKSSWARWSAQEHSSAMVCRIRHSPTSTPKLRKFLRSLYVRRRSVFWSYKRLLAKPVLRLSLPAGGRAPAPSPPFCRSGGPCHVRRANHHNHVACLFVQRL